MCDKKSKDKIGTNEPCPCGSGKKYKKCCALQGLATSKDIIVAQSRQKMLQNLDKLCGTKQKYVRNTKFESMSDVLLEYAEPFTESLKNDDKNEFEQAIQIAIVLWNCAVFREQPDKKKAYKKGLKMLKGRMCTKEDSAVIEMMLERKRLLFPDNNRIIMGVDVSDVGDNFHIEVASTLAEGQAELVKEEDFI